jgi:hypothetical protein
MRISLKASGWTALFVAAGLLAGCSGAGQSLGVLNQPPAGASGAMVPVADAKFAFAQVTGAPPEEVSTIADGITEEAKASGLTLVQEGDPSATYLVKGYLSAVGGSSGTVVIYVWDVLDMQGGRLHRISGQENAAGSGGDPWAGVDDGVLETIARDTVGRLAAWVRSR